MLGPFALLLLGTLIPGDVTTQMSPTSHVERAHGTVNVFLAAGGNLVAVTDSMLTFGANQHLPNGLKLYKLDARTICAMAGSYSEAGPHNLDI